MKQITNTDTAESSWHDIYIIGGIATLLTLAGTLLDIVLTMIPGWEATTVPTTIEAWFIQFQTNPLLGLRNLDLLNATLSVIGVPMIVALYGAHRRACPAYATLALSVALVGTGVFVTSNVALPMLDLSRQYATASTDTQRLAIEAAGGALLARGAHGSLGVFAGFFLPSIGTLLMGIAMLVGKVFKRVTAWMGIAGISLLTIYTIGVTFAPTSGEAMMIVALPGGLLIMAWNILVARRLLQLGTAHRVMAKGR
jgi:hypothetical protein